MCRSFYLALNMDAMEKIKNYFNSLVKMEDSDWVIFSSKLEKVEFPKKSLLLKMGHTERYLSFIEYGIVRFNIPKLDHDFTFGFAFENSFVSAYDSFLTQSPSFYNVEAITDCVLWRISFDDLNSVYKCTQVGNIIGRKAAEDIFLKKMKREVSLLEDTAKTRYLNLLREQPQMIKHIPLKYLASYIGVRPQSLSRIRKEIY
ncbi:Cyclic nucleotide-binding domain [Sphingobacterium thalpophilum]|uniref:Cyclic nucleotide-binding domain n=2 Tax=Sphingobacterium thalpophilum TaxID=259 RepID=A0A4U9W7S0_9SPHI|nr:Cyclic nucleotide-binding domain [Sphingobacterium thalpophilum]